MKICHIILLIGLVISPAFAEPEPLDMSTTVPQYRVEIIIFSHLTRTSLNSELWPVISPPLFSQSQAQFLPQQQLTLNTAVKRLSEAPHYQVLMYTGWQQGLANHYTSQAVRVTNEYIDGTITINRQRFINSKFNLYFSLPAKTLAEISGNPYFTNAFDQKAYFHLQQTRRMRTNELNYIDNPLFGILIKITPINRTA